MGLDVTGDLAKPAAGSRPAAAPRVPAQPRAVGSIRLSAKRHGARSVLDGLRPQGCLKALFPRHPDPARGLEAVLINSAGGITGGDRLAITAHAGPGARLSITTQAAERIYAAQPGETGTLRTTLSAAPGATLNWLPQETILFNRAGLSRALSADLAGDARFLMVESLLFGRRAMGERVTDLRLHDRVEILRDGQPLYLDAARIDGDAEALLDRPATGGGARAMAALVYTAPGAEALLPVLRAGLPRTAGASCIAPDTLALRLLAPDGAALRRLLLPLLARLADGPIPRSWMT
ncbi:urease accessory protein UreD [Poseidonocella sedimentorum]|uniref:Urease accessory protein UreD n=1 Tax=Poseidonocella sedimentorum TaxID=871652 RepID=A0A1I6CN29_9RHOB|nr:urease accessory protein UreD [Poseidonocella sedimentorum]SFQ94594.1 urease accessory protein [Poseidonocella sedimentorum]